MKQILGAEVANWSKEKKVEIATACLESATQKYQKTGSLIDRQIVEDWMSLLEDIACDRF